MSTKLLSRSGKLSIISHVPVINPALDYSTGDLLDAKITLSDAAKFSGGAGVIRSVVITDLAKLSIDKDVVFFDADPGDTTFTDNAALDIDDDDLPKVIGVVNLATWDLFADNAVAVESDLFIPFVLPSASSDLFCAIVERGTANYVLATDITLRVGIMAA